MNQTARPKWQITGKAEYCILLSFAILNADISNLLYLLNPEFSYRMMNNGEVNFIHDSSLSFIQVFKSPFLKSSIDHFGGCV